MSLRPKLTHAIAEGVLLCIFLAFHCVAAGIFIVGGFLLHHLLIKLGDPKLYEIVPWRYAMDTLDLMVLALLVFSLVKFVLLQWRAK
jgi:hypothetical protein